MNATELLAIAHGVQCVGDGKCFYCGNPAGEHALELSGAFNDWSSMAHSDSDVICAGCKIALDEKRTMSGRDKPQKVRNWSWLITLREAHALGDVASIRNACLSPPDPPYALAIAVSGQKHILWRTPVNGGGDSCVVQFELLRVAYRIEDLRYWLNIAMRLAAASGKPALTVPLDVGLFMRLDESGMTEAEINQWYDRAAEPLLQLAAHICPSKEECLRDKAT